MADTKPILLRPPVGLADAMEAAARDSGVSRQQWMLEHLADAAESEGHAVVQAAGPDDVPLFG